MLKMISTHQMSVAVGETSMIVKELQKLSVSFEKSLKEIPDITADKIIAKPVGMRASDANTDNFKKLTWTGLSLSPTDLEVAAISPEYDPTLACVRKFAEDILIARNSSRKSERANVQIPSSILVNDLTAIFYPGTNASMKREHSFDDILVEGPSTSFSVRSQIDVSIVLGDTIETPIFPLENKSMTVLFKNKDPTGAFAKGLCQSAYDMACVFQKYHASYGMSIPFLFGALTNGIQWIFVSLDSTSAKPKFSRTIVFNLISDSAIDKDQSTLIAKYLVLALRNVKGFVVSAQIPQTPAAINLSAASSDTPIPSTSSKNVSTLSSRPGGNKGKLSSSSTNSTGKDYGLSKASELNKENLLKLMFSQRHAA
jgi:hypothetical protein